MGSLSGLVCESGLLVVCLRGDIFRRSFIRMEKGVQISEEMPQIVRIAPVISVQEGPESRKTRDM